MPRAKTCSHLDAVAQQRAEPTQPSSHGCKECLAIGAAWVHLRLCLSCGHVGCCDDSPNRHATAHFHATRHPVIKSFEPGEDWAWCFADELATEQIPAFPEESPKVHYRSPAESR
jgi:uncharacterized UBP type Zn finger protein